MDEYCRFILNSAERKVWDWSTLNIEHIQTDSEATEVPLDSESSFIFTESVTHSFLFVTVHFQKQDAFVVGQP